ncbi:MAG: hypothetical protein UT58_C0011G0021 [Microgenomates group bacterium GW2011_GWC1_39_7b]|uniref:Glycosyltransferase RgtA/B/C/D-like domain-containing protein n=3 Tax=Candidatus Woeseibacteriota TaxID=1752722 RepID=A0A0G0LJS3_9BACT|nr:MAG: hypothetical protein UT17_C0003G0166 [Candidatus Woesebacteria bacterium GW2011_GWB1_39_10]KKR26522.1 MAG: hypothetical protein UT58_C0011G0021 [Microgenomates group bacterium GW2011_GWC1_39_7b]KKR73579.1 MAG: hypothetical protein UU16_C0018G0004 [Candidatus Woesebacteria bacterium GW2011_GWA2_40_7]KKS91103.1 MAG: hypothetical protein UV66_C0001G0460 [Candidatus Woesebacteria bacterium GW2011_GWA1_43_12]
MIYQVQFLPELKFRVSLKSVMKSLWQKFHKIGDTLRLPNIPNWLCGLLFLVLILRIPSFFEPYYYGDEMVYMTLGQGVRQGLSLYRDVYDNKPPLLYLAAATADNLFWFKVILAFWMLISSIWFYKLSKTLFGQNEGAQKISTIVFAILTTLPLLEGNTVNSELFMIGFTILALLTLLKHRLTSKRVLFAGILLGLGTLFKVPAAFDAPIIVVYWLITGDLKKEWKEIIKNTFVLILGFTLPIVLTFIWYYFAGALPEYIKAAFLQNIGYLSSFRPSDIQKPFIIRNAPLLTRALIVLIGSIVIWFFRKKLSKRFILFAVWTLFALFAITLSERPYPHYFIQVVAPISFLLTMFFTSKNIEQSLAVIPLAIAFTVPVLYKFYLYPTTSYYLRFVNFATHKINKSVYFDGFSSTTNRNYQIALFLSQSSRKTDRVFMWDPDSAAVYSLAKRLPPIKYVVPYHVNDFSSRIIIAKQIEANPPRFIILTSGNPYPELTVLIANKYILLQQIDGANIYSSLP